MRQTIDGDGTSGNPTSVDSLDISLQLINIALSSTNASSNSIVLILGSKVSRSMAANSSSVTGDGSIHLTSSIDLQQLTSVSSRSSVNQHGGGDSVSPVHGSQRGGNVSQLAPLDGSTSNVNDQGVTGSVVQVSGIGDDIDLTISQLNQIANRSVSSSQRSLSLSQVSLSEQTAGDISR